MIILKKYRDENRWNEISEEDAKEYLEGCVKDIDLALEAMRMGSTVDTMVAEYRMRYEIGDQIACIPDHAEGNFKHSDVEFGFVTGYSKSGDPFCRYWSKYNPGELRTKANSECTPQRCLVLKKSHLDGDMEYHLNAIGISNG